jgi:hypothetical protein
MMFFTSSSSKTCRFFLFFVAACNAVTAAAKESKVELTEFHHRALRGVSPTTNAATPVESVANGHSRKLGVYTGFNSNLAVQSGAGITFTHPATTIWKGNVCADRSFTGRNVNDYVLGDEDGASVRTGECGPQYLIDLLADAMAVTATPIPAEMGGLPQPFNAGSYIGASLTIADNTVVILRGKADDIFLFQSGSDLVTGENTTFVLQDDNGVEADENDPSLFNGVQAKNVLFALTAAATTGAGSSLPGSILAGAAVTLGAGSDVGGYVLATAAMNAGEGCDVNSAEIVPDVASPSISPITILISSAACRADATAC